MKIGPTIRDNGTNEEMDLRFWRNELSIYEIPREKMRREIDYAKATMATKGPN